MKKKLLPNQASIEELLASLEAETEEVSEVVLDDDTFINNDEVVQFLSIYDITPGDMPVKKTMLYKLYRTYTKEPLDQLQFHRRVGNFLSHYRNTNGNFYSINKNSFVVASYIFKHKNEGKIRKTHTPKYQQHFQWFLTNSKISKGTKWIEGFILHEMYKKYCAKRQSSVLLGYENFHKFLRLFFEYRRIGENRCLWFKVNEEALGLLTEEEIRDIREARKNPKKGASRSGKKKKPS